jgi:hypothetical protein
MPFDLMVPEHLAGSASRRGVRIPPHDKRSARRAAGLEAAMIDDSHMTVESLDGDGRSAFINVAGLAALLVAKLQELGERVEMPDLAGSLCQLPSDGLSHEVATRALGLIEQLFAVGPEALGSMMAGRAGGGWPARDRRSVGQFPRARSARRSRRRPRCR